MKTILGQAQKSVWVLRKLPSYQLGLIQTERIGCLTVRNYSAAAFDSRFHTGMTQCTTQQFVRYAPVLYWRVDFRTVIELEFVQYRVKGAA